MPIDGLEVDAEAMGYKNGVQEFALSEIVVLLDDECKLQATRSTFATLCLCVSISEYFADRLKTKPH